MKLKEWPLYPIDYRTEDGFLNAIEPLYLGDGLYRSPYHVERQDVVFDPVYPEKVIAYIETLTLSAGEHTGLPFRLRWWQREIVYKVYGPQWIASGTQLYDDNGEFVLSVEERQKQLKRVVRQCVYTVARKNGKTEFIGGLVLCHLQGPLARRNQQIYSAAADRYQAALVFQAMVAMIIADEELNDELHHVDTGKRIKHAASNSFYQALSADAKTKHGFNPSLVIYDELAQAPDRQLYDVLTTALGAQKDPLTFVISTQSPDPNHPMSELVDYAQLVHTGEVEDPTVLLIMYHTPEEDDPWAEENWYKANPGLGDFRSLEEMRTYAERAKKLPSLESTFRNLYLNQRVDATAAFISRSAWEACGGEIIRHDFLEREWYAGLDLSAKNDLTALVLVGADPNSPNPEAPIYDIVPFFWVPGQNLKEKEFMDKVPYTLWARDGFIEQRHAATIDYGWVAHKLAELVADGWRILGIGFDRWRIDDFRRECEELGIYVPMVPHGQGYKDMNPSVEVVEDLVTEKRLRHAMHPVLTWNASCCVVESDPAGNRKFAKNKSKGRIDGFVALSMALRLAELGDTAASVYEKRELLVLGG